jgi:hypothetical protein
MVLELVLLEHPRKIQRRFDEDTRCCIIIVFRAKHFEKFEIFGDVVNSNISTRIIGYSTVLSDLGLILVLSWSCLDLDLKDLELDLLEHPKKIQIRFDEDTRCCIIVVFRAKHFEKFKIFGYVVNLNIFTRIFGYSTVLSDLGLVLILSWSCLDLDLKDRKLDLLEHPKKIR